MDQIELAEEADGEGHTDEGEEAEGEEECGEGVGAGDAGEVVEIFGGVGFALEVDEDGESAEVHDGIAGKVEEGGVDAVGVIGAAAKPGDDADEHVTECRRWRSRRRCV